MVLPKAQGRRAAVHVLHHMAGAELDPRVQLKAVQELRANTESDPSFVTGFLAAGGVAAVVKALRQFCFHTALQTEALRLFAAAAAQSLDAGHALRQAGLVSMAASATQRHGAEAPDLVEAAHDLARLLLSLPEQPRTQASQKQRPHGAKESTTPKKKDRRTARRARRQRSPSPTQRSAADLIGRTSHASQGPASSPMAYGMGEDQPPPHAGARLLRQLSPPKGPGPKPRRVLKPLRRPRPQTTALMAPASSPMVARPRTERLRTVAQRAADGDSTALNQLADTLPEEAPGLLRSVEDRLKLAATLMAARRFDEALAEYSGILMSDPDCVSALYNSALLAARQKDTARAVSLLDRVLAVEPRHAGAVKASTALKAPTALR